jgi:hypothetical protein
MSQQKGRRPAFTLLRRGLAEEEMRKAEEAVEKKGPKWI